jgi:DNA anti-recombination protein RmuC
MNLALLILAGVIVVLVIAGVMALVLLLMRQNQLLTNLRAQTLSGEQDRENRATSAIERLTGAVATRNQIEDQALLGIRRLERLLSGSAGRGAAGENIVEQSLRHLPDDLIERDFWVNGKVVEFALKLPDGKKLAIDSKWTSGGVLEALGSPDLDPAEAVRLTNQLEKEVERKVREVAQYLDHSTTASIAIAAVPDAVYAVCRKVFALAQSRNVVIISYSLTLPYLLSLYQMYLQFGRNLDTGNLEAALLEIDRYLNEIDSSLENKLQRALTMVQNSYAETKQASSRIRSAALSIHVAANGSLKPSESLDLQPVGALA